MEPFLAWFNRESAQTIEQYILRAYWDFTLHILTPAICARIADPEEKIALEIGYGGGRMINAACNYFQEIIGIDIHNEQESVAAFLHAQNKSNFRLLRTAGNTIDVDDESVDFVYSFIVLQHLPSFTTFVNYLQEVYRCLKLGGVAQLYFGRFTRLHPIYQCYYYWQGYKETHGVPPNHISLVVRTSKVKQVCRDIGLKVVATGTSFFLAPNGYPVQRGGQSYITLVKSGD